MDVLMDLKARMAAALKAARDIDAAAKNAGRDMTPAEIESASAHLKSYNDLKAELASSSPFSAENAAKVKAALADIGLDLGLDGDTRTPSKAVSGRSSKQKAAENWGGDIRDRIQKSVGAEGAKALIGGTIDIPSVIAEPVLINGRPTTILDLIPRRPRTASADPRDVRGNTFEYLLQTARNLAASSVPDNATKPVSGVTFDDKEDRYRVYATITDPMPKRFLDDYTQLVEILKTQLGEGLQEALEADILLGTGTPTATTDPVLGILNTSGIQVQAFATDVITTLRTARRKIEDSRATPNAWVMNSIDLQALEMLRENGTTGALLFGSGRTTIEQILGDYPIVESPLIAAGSALLGDFTKTELLVREDDHLDVDGSGELFKKNQVVFREEGRYGFATLKPSSFITVDLTA
jgi:HK97 family phage major capsid protein